MLNTNIIQSNKKYTDNMTSSNSYKPRFKLIYNIESNENANDCSEEMKVYIDWGGSTKRTLLQFPLEILKKYIPFFYWIAYYLWQDDTKFKYRWLYRDTK